MTSMSARQRSLGYGIMLANWPTPEGHATISQSDRAYQWANYYGSVETPNPYYKDDYLVTTNALLVEQFKWRG